MQAHIYININDITYIKIILIHYFLKYYLMFYNI